METIKRKINIGMVFYALVFLNIIAWIFLIIPVLIKSGLVHVLKQLSSSPFCIFVAFSLFCSIFSLTIFASHIITYIFLGSLSLSDKRNVLKGFLTDNSILQVVLIILRCSNPNSIEGLLWAIVYSNYACIKGMCLVISLRISENNLKNLSPFIHMLIFLTISILLLNLQIFTGIGFWNNLLLNFDSLLILKLLIQSYYTICLQNKIPALVDKILEIFDSALIISKWLHLEFSNGGMTSLNPLEFVILVKLQGHFSIISKQIKQYFQFKDSIKQFKDMFPDVSKDEINLLGEEKCCICWDLLSAEKCCRLNCGHSLHTECVWKCMTKSIDRKCPMCRKIFIPLGGRFNMK